MSPEYGRGMDRSSSNSPSPEILRLLISSEVKVSTKCSAENFKNFLVDPETKPLICSLASDAIMSAICTLILLKLVPDIEACEALISIELPFNNRSADMSVIFGQPGM